LSVLTVLFLTERFTASLRGEARGWSGSPSAWVADVSAARNAMTCRLRLLSAPSRNGGSHLDVQPGSPHRPREMLHPPPGVRVEGALTNGAGTVPMSRPLTDWLRATARSPKRAHPAAACGLRRGHQRNCRQAGYMRPHLVLARRAAAESVDSTARPPFRRSPASAIRICMSPSGGTATGPALPVRAGAGGVGKRRLRGVVGDVGVRFWC